MKKIISLLFTILLPISLFGCQSSKSTDSTLPSSKTVSSQTNNTDKTKSIIAPTFANTKWGMTPEQAFEALGTTKGDWKEITSPMASDDVAVETEYAKESLEVYGAKVAVFLTFAHAFDVGLISATIRYDADTVTHDVIYSQLVEIYEQPKQSANPKLMTWESPAVKDVLTEQEWDNGKLIDAFYKERTRIKNEAKNTNASDSNSSGIEIDFSQDNQPLSTISDSDTVSARGFQSFYFEGVYAAVLKWDGKLHKE